MAFTELEKKKYEDMIGAFIDKRRPPPELRDQVDLQFRIKGQSVEIFEVRPFWRDPRRKIEESIAKATYVSRRRIWKVFWQRADLKWHGYPPMPEVKTVANFLEIVDEDENCCFWG